LLARVAGSTEHAVVLALDFVERVTERRQKILGCRDDGAIEVELDHGLRFADGDRLCERALRCLALQVEQFGLRELAPQTEPLRGEGI
jgi:hypothetical protein